MPMESQEEIMFVVRSFLASALLLSTVQSVAKELAYYDSLRLVGAMREDERMLRVVREQKLQSSKWSQQDLQCLDSLEYPVLTDIVARQIGYSMTAAEVQDALNYFQSSGGRKFVKRELGVLGETQFATADRAELDKFKQRPAGRKLFGGQVLQEAEVMAEAAERIDRLLGDCAYLRKNDLEREIPEKSCQARPVSSSDNACLATYVAEGNAKKPRHASVEVNCRQDGRVLTSRIGLPKPEVPIALRWSASRELEILVDGKVKNAPSSAGSGPKVSFASWQKDDPPLLTCATQTRGRPTLANALPPNVAVGAWRTYGQPGLCVMTARVPKEQVRGAEGDVLLQFRRQKPATAPFGTTDLAVVVAVDQQSERPLFVDFKTRMFELIAQPPQQQHMLTGSAAETVLESVRVGPVDLTVRSEDGNRYAIPMRGLDFDFAYADFSECLEGLAAM
jgi:hypothetical protein